MNEYVYPNPETVRISRREPTPNLPLPPPPLNVLRAGLAVFSRIFYPSGPCPWPCVSSLVVVNNNTGSFRVVR